MVATSSIIRKELNGFVAPGDEVSFAPFVLVSRWWLCCKIVTAATEPLAPGALQGCERRISINLWLA